MIALVTSSPLAPAADQPPSKANTSPPATQPLEKSAAAQLVRRFQADLRAKDTAAASKHLATLPQPLPDTDRRLARLAKLYSAGTWDLSVIDAYEAGDVAVVLVNEHLKDNRKTFDVDPWYLLRQDGQWKLLPKFTDFEIPAYGFTPDRLDAYRQLETWANTRTQELKKQQPDCGC